MSEKQPDTKKYHLVVACGTAIATSTHVAIKVKELLAERGMTVTTTQCRVAEVPSYTDGAQAVVATAQVPFDIDIPIINGVPFLTGVGLKEVIDEIESVLKKS